MKKTFTRLHTLALCLLIGSASLHAQGTDGYGSGLKLNLDSTGKKYVRFITWHQVWMRYSENNPGSTVNSVKTDNQWDMSLRRSRVLLFAQINPNFLILTHFGINNANQISGGGVGQGANVGAATVDGKKPQLFMHDAWVEHKVYKDHASIGAGLHYWQGPSRLASASTLNFLGMDSPIFTWQNIDATDQFARQYGVYMKGKLFKSKRLDYRVAVNFPFAIARGNALGNLDTTVARHDIASSAYRTGGQPSPAYTGYFSYNFLDIESNLLPYYVGSYLGTKKIFNVGAGFYQHKDAMWTASRNATTNRIDTVNQTQLNASVDVFADIPFGEARKTALTFYGSYNYMYYGDNYVRNIGIDNPANGSIAAKASYNGVGNAMPIIGTGHVLFFQGAFLLPKMKGLGRIQPYASVMYAKYERIADNVVIPDIGTHIHFAGHSCRMSLNYRLRPVYAYDNTAQRWSDIHLNGKRKSEFTVQFQIYL